VVIDESHNFRNNEAYRERETRYQKLMNSVIRDGVKTKVLMLSATPVNNRFNDLRNQLALAYEGESENLSKKLKTGKSIEEIFRAAQTAFNQWSKLPPENRTARAILDALDFDFFELLDSVTIAEISKERIRRAGKKILKEMASKDKPKTKDDQTGDLFTEPVRDNFSDFRVFRGSNKLDTGFRVLKVDSGNMADIYYTPDALSQDGLFNLTDNIKSDRSEEELLFQVLLDWGVDLAYPITKETIDTNDVYFVDNNALAACFVKKGRVTEAFCKELAKRQPLRVVFRDAGFKDGSVKINVEQIFKLMSPHTDVRTI